MIYIKIHKGVGTFITAVCDSDLIGKKFKKGKLVLNVSERFYKGKLVKEDKVKEYLESAVSLNIVGKKSIEITLSLGLISKENILIIRGVPHAQCVVL